jgi:hypothetical protein
MRLPSEIPYEFLSQIPASRPPPGVVPNFEDPYTRGPLFIALSGVAVGFMYLFLIVRFYSKFCTRRKLTWDDCEWAMHDSMLRANQVGALLFSNKHARGSKNDSSPFPLLNMRSITWLLQLGVTGIFVGLIYRKSNPMDELVELAFHIMFQWSELVWARINGICLRAFCSRILSWRCVLMKQFPTRQQRTQWRA